MHKITTVVAKNASSDVVTVIGIDLAKNVFAPGISTLRDRVCMTAAMLAAVTQIEVASRSGRITVR